MKILWLSPWMRTLARVHAQALAACGHEVVLVTSDQHPEQVDPRGWEIVLDPRPKSLPTWAQFGRAFPGLRGFHADVVVTELVRDPRWMAFAGRAPRVNVIHDDRPHDAHETVPRWESQIFRRWHGAAKATICFSDHVARSVPTTPAPTVIALTSDVDDSRLAAPATADGRRDFVMVGRLNGYKNVDVVLRAWDMHRASESYRGDRLRLFGQARTDVLPPGALPEGVCWNGGSYDYRSLLPVLAAAKGSVADYRVATQSGVQVLSMQAGVAPIVSTEGALPEFQPPGLPVVDKDDVAGLASAFDLLADPAVASRAGEQAREHFQRHYSAAVAARQMEELFTRVR